MEKLTKSILQKQTWVSDGAWGTMLQSAGLKAGECPELWNLTMPHKVFEVAKSYVEAGACLIETNSFGANYLKLAQFGIEAKADEINYEAAVISCRAAEGKAWVMGSVGPTGKFLITGEVTTEELLQIYGRQAHALEQGGADAILLETMSDLGEALAAIEGTRMYTSLPVFCTFTFEKKADGTYRTMMGVTPAEMARALASAGADAIGANCGNGIDDMLPIVRQIRSIDTQLPLIVHANAGLPSVVDGKTLFPEDPQTMASKAKLLADEGVSVIGGCCGTTPDHIRAIAKIIYQ